MSTALLLAVSGAAGYAIGRGHQWYRTAKSLMGTTRTKGRR